jgi:hypothetical protein
MTDLFRVNPDHIPGRYYWSENNPEQGWPEFQQPIAPDGMPLWAFRQIEQLKLLKYFIHWWIDNRQIENGEFGGGLSDDGDLTNLWPGAALMGITPEKITESVLAEMEAFYHNEMFSNGLSTILTDELHSYEEGIQVLPQVMLLKYGDPKAVERLMETARAYERLTGINDAGHRHIRSSYFSGTQIIEEGVWQWSKPYSYLILHPGLSLVEFNGHPKIKELLLEIANGLLAHRRKNTDGHFYLPADINFLTDEDRDEGNRFANHLFWAAWRWTEDKKYLLPLKDEIKQGNFKVLSSLNANVIDLLDKRKSWGQQFSSSINPKEKDDYSRHLAWQITGDKRFLEAYYADQIQMSTQRMYLVTEGHWWSDRVRVASAELQRSRLGGVALMRSAIYPGHAISWRFQSPANAESVAMLVPKNTASYLKIIAYNPEIDSVNAIMTAWDMAPGTWQVITGIDEDGDDTADQVIDKSSVMLERTRDLKLTFAPGVTTIIELSLKSKAKPMWQRSDLGISTDDIRFAENSVHVTIHNLGSVTSPISSIALLNPDGKIISMNTVPSMEAPLDLLPKTSEVTITFPANLDLTGYRLCIDPDKKLNEITRLNNSVTLNQN